MLISVWFHWGSRAWGCHSHQWTESQWITTADSGLRRCREDKSELRRSDVFQTKPTYELTYFLTLPSYLFSFLQSSMLMIPATVFYLISGDGRHHHHHHYLRRLLTWAIIFSPFLFFLSLISFWMQHFFSLSLVRSRSVHFLINKSRGSDSI